MAKEWKLQSLVTKRRETKRGLSAQRNTKLSPLPLLSPQKNFSITKHILSSCFYSFFHSPPNSFPTSKRTRLTSDLHDSSSMSFKIKHQVFSFLLQLFSFILFLFPPSHMPVQCQRGRDLSIITTREHTGSLGNRHRRWGDVCVYSSSLLRTWTTNKKNVHATCWLKGSNWEWTTISSFTSEGLIKISQ